ncbi:MAG: hypothetical protein LBT22_06485 [Peptococcaceae bacterium]|nr:hypothetical protein [Peptococcaceae bacterium]
MQSSVWFLHGAGFLFDSPDWEGPASWVKQRNQDVWQTFEELLALCLKERIDLLLLTGNLFEQEFVKKETVERVARSLARLNGTRVFIAPGEKDPMVTTSAYRLSEWPENVHIFAGGMSRIALPALNLSVYGSGWIAYRREEADLPTDFQMADDEEEIRLMLLHAGAETLTIPASGLNYLALGSRENWSGIQQTGKTYWADCGSIEARSFRAEGPHGVILGHLEGTSAQFEFLELGRRRYREKSLRLQPETDIKAAAKGILADIEEQERAKDVFRIRLTGSFPETEDPATALQKRLEEKLAYVEVLFSGDDTTEPANPPEEAEQLREERFATFRRIFAYRLQIRCVGAEKAEDQVYWQLVQKIGLSALGQGREDEN